MYKTLARPLIDYRIPAWRPYAKRDITPITGIQKRLTKLVNKCKGKPYIERIKKLGVTTLEDIHYRADMIQVFTILNYRQNTYLVNFLARNNRVSRNNCLKLQKNRCTLKLS